MIIYARGARQYLRKLKATRFAGKSHLSKAQRKKLWNYGDDELEIRPDATSEQVQYALDTVGSGDQFERLRDEAFRLHGASQKAVKEHPEVDRDKAMDELWVIIGQDRELGSPSRGRTGKYKSADFSVFK